MISQKTLKNGKVSITSSFFEDANLVRASLRESMQDDYVSSKWRRDKGRDFTGLQLATTIQSMLLAKQGMAELKDFVQNRINSQKASNYKINYGPWKDYESYETLKSIQDDLEAKQANRPLEASEISELDRVKSKIKEIDDFVERQMENISKSHDD